MKKIWKMILVILAIGMLSACNAHQTPDASDEARTKAETNDKDVEQGTVSDDAKNTSGADGENYVLYDLSYGNMVYIIDADGKQIAAYDLAKVRNHLADAGYHVDNLELRAGRKDELYFYQYDWDGTNGKYLVSVVDPSTYELITFCEIKDGYILDEIDLYQDRVYINASKYDSETQTSEPQEFVYTVSKADGKFVVSAEDEELEKFFDSLKRYNPIKQYTYVCNGWIGASYARILDEVGFVLASKDGYYVKIAADGTVSSPISAITAVDSNPYIWRYDANYIVYGVYDYNSMDYLYKLYDINDDSISNISVPEKDMSVLEFADGSIYYCVDKSEEYGLLKHEIYKYNCADNSNSLLYKASATPGTNGLTPGTAGFNLIAGHIYYIAANGDKMEWVSTTADEKKTGQNPAAIGCTVSQLDNYRYGKVIYMSKTVNCPYCGTALEKNYDEAFVLDSKYSGHADEINDYLKKDMESFVNGEQNSEEGGSQEFTDEYCDEHREYPMQWCETNDYYVSAVKILNEKYLVVNMNGYWYGGGAHGYPLRTQKVFELSTGKHMEIKDFYQGSEEAFKKLVAEKTKEDFERYDYRECPYFAEDSDAAYRQAYDLAGFESTSVEFDENGAVVVYAPYEMGAYASGYIEVSIPYEDLLGRETL